MAKWLAWQTAVEVRVLWLTHECTLQCRRGLSTVVQLFMNGNTGLTEFIISMVKMVNMPLAWLPHLKEGKNFGMLLLLFSCKNSETDLNCINLKKNICGIIVYGDIEWDIGYIWLSNIAFRLPVYTLLQLYFICNISRLCINET